MPQKIPLPPKALVLVLTNQIMMLENTRGTIHWLNYKDCYGNKNRGVIWKLKGVTSTMGSAVWNG